MFDFTSDYWTWFIAIPVIGGMIALVFLIRWMEKPPKDGSTFDGKPLSHVWDEDLVELNNPMPKWWTNLFYATIVFALVYLLLYPGIGKWEGLLGWTQAGQYETENKVAAEKFDPIFKAYLSKDIDALQLDPVAMKSARRLFGNYCAICHGSDAGGGLGFPNLTDHDWLYGDTPEAIRASITNGRNGMMPPWEAVLGKEGTFNVSSYVLSLSGRQANENAVRMGKQKFSQLCIGCHGVDGKGNQALGAPNLTDKVWLYGGSQRSVMRSISKGRTGRMPMHKDFLSEAKIHLLTAYVFSLSADDKP